MRYLCIFGVLCFLLIVFSQKGHAQCNVGATYKQIYKEDFESGVEPGFTTTYSYNTSYLTGIGKGTYSIRKSFESFDNTANCSNGFCWGTWGRKGRDHTSGNGYFYIVNGMDVAAGVTDYFFEKTFTGLCGGTTLQFEIWVVNPCFSGCSNYPDFLIEFINPTSNVVIKSVRPFPATTNPLYHSYNPPGTTVWEDKGFQWRLVRSTMSLPSTVGSVKVRVKNLVTGTNESGNDIVIDDISFSVCVPGSTGTQSCANTSVTQESVNMAVTTTGITNPKYQWQRSSNQTIWTDIAGATASTYTSPLESSATARYYRCRYGESTMIITGETNINCTGQYVFTLPARVFPSIGASNIKLDCTRPSATLRTDSHPSGTSYQWYKNGTAVSGATSQTYVVTTPGQYTVGTLAPNTTCRLTSSAISITAEPAQSAGSLTATKTATCYNTAPGIINGSAATGGTGTGTYTYLWEQSTNSGATWAAATGTSNTQNYTPPALTATTQYRRKATNICGTVTSSIVTITVYGIQSAGSLTATKTATCYNTAPGIINGSAATGGTGAYTYLWEQSTNSGATWVTATGTSNTQNYTPPALTTTTQYRRKATNTCGTVTSNTVTITVYGIQSAGSLTATKTATCYNTAPGIINGSAATGGTGAYTYLWEQSTNSGATWAAATGTSNTQNYTPPALTATTQYRRKATNTCGAVTSSIVTITVYGIQSAGSLTATKTATCYNTAPGIINGSAATGGTGTYTYLWEQSTNSGATWVAATGTSNTQNYTPPALTTTTQYRRKATNTCGTVTSNTVTITVYGIQSAGSLTATKTATCYNTAPGIINGSAATGGTGAYTYLWEQSTNSGTTWAAATGTSNTQNYTPPALTATTQYRRKATNTCGTVTSSIVTITVYGIQSAGSLTATKTATCYNTAPGIINGSAATGGTGAYTYLWEQSTNSGTTWAAATGTSNTQNYTPPALTATTQYRRKATNTCGTVTSSIVTITVYGIQSAGSLTATKTATCYNTAPGIINGATATGGTGTYTYLWEQSTNSGATWVTATGTSNTQNYTPPALTTTTQYRRKATNTCGTVTSSIVTITVYGIQSAGSLTATKTATCYNTAPGIINGSAATGGTGAYTYLWEQSTNSGATWAAATGTSNTQNYTPPALTTTTQYRRRATNTCGTVTSNTVTITVYGIQSAGSLTATKTATCYNTAPGIINGATATGGTGTYTYLWEQSTNSGATWVAATGTSNTQNYTPPVLTTTTQYRRKATNTCGTVTSSIVTITVYGIQSAGSLTVTKTATCYNTAPGIINGAAATGGTGTYTYLWEQSTNSGATWAAATGTSNTQNYTPPALTTTTQYRRKATNTCGTVTSSTITVTVYGIQSAGSLTATKTATCYNTAPGIINGAAATGSTGTYTYLWEQSTNSGTTWVAATGTSNTQNYTPPALTATTQYRRKATNTCGTVTSSTITVTVYGIQSAGSLTATKTATCYNTAPGIINGAAATGGTGTYTYLWEQSTNSGTTWAAATGTSNTQNYTPPVLTTTTQYRRKATNTCGTVTSSIVTITVYGIQSAGSLTATKTATCYNTAPGIINGAAATGGTGTYTYLWEQSTNSGTTWAAATGTSNTQNYTPPVLTTTTQYRRKATNTCGAVTSSTVTVTVYPKPILSSTLIPTAICSGTTFGYTATSATTGTTFTWTRAVVAGITPSVVGNGTNGIISEALTNTSSEPITVAYIFTLTANGCTNIQNVSVVVNPEVVPGAIAGIQSICNGIVPAVFTSTTVASGGAGIISYQWQNSIDNGATWTDIIGAVAATYTAPALTVTTHYRRNAKSANCAKVVSTSPIIITVNPALTATAAKVDIACNGANSGKITVTASGGNGVYQYSMDNQVTWQASNVFSNLAPGVYTIHTMHTKDGISCPAPVITATITEQAVVLIPANVSSPLACPNKPAEVHIKNSLAGVSYAVYDAPTGGTQKGVSMMGNGGILVIYVGTHSVSTTLYVETKSNGGTCTSVSRVPVSIVVRDIVSQYPDIRIQICPVPNRTINLSSYLDTAYFHSVNWTTASVSSPALTSPTGSASFQTNQLNDGTHAYYYTLSNACYTNVKAKVYVNSFANTPHKRPGDTIVVCRNTSNMNLNQTLGLDAKGKWLRSTDYNPYLGEVAPPSIFSGAFLLDVKAAYTGLQGTTHKKGYRTDPTAVHVNLKYSTVGIANSCWANKERDLVIIITSTQL